MRLLAGCKQDTIFMLRLHFICKCKQPTQLSVVGVPVLTWPHACMLPIAPTQQLVAAVFTTQPYCYVTCLLLAAHSCQTACRAWQAAACLPTVCRPFRLPANHPSAPDSWLTGTLPDWLGSMQNLEQLNMGQTWLEGTFPAAIGGLKRLRELNLEATG